MRIAFKTFGCKANSLDTDALYLEARRRGFEIVGETEIADAYVINSCTVTHGADRDARAQVNRFKRVNPRSIVGVVGCYAQVAKEELLNLAGVDFVVGTADKARILDLFAQSFGSARSARDQVSLPSGFLPEKFPGSRHSRAAIKIQDGCNFSCSFCIIPRARGRSRSLPMDSVLKQIEEAADQGFREVVLTGIHLAHFGWDHGTTLMGLLEKIFQSNHGPRVRLSTLDPFEIPDDLIEMLGREPRLCPHLHIAIQSGSDQILGRMRRIYKVEEFTAVTRKIFEQNKDTFVGVDVIVGFPGEGEEEFQETRHCLENSYWTKLHVFPFSLRQGTRAETLDGRVRDSVISERSKILLEMSQKRYRKFLEAQIGTEREVLLEQASKKHSGMWLGHTENYCPTYSEAQASSSGKILRSKVESLEGDKLFTRAV